MFKKITQVHVCLFRQKLYSVYYNCFIICLFQMKTSGILLVTLFLTVGNVYIPTVSGGVLDDLLPGIIDNVSK